MLPPCLGATCRQRPEGACEIDLAPRHAGDLSAALAGQNHQVGQIAIQRLELFRGAPDLANSSSDSTRSLAGAGVVSMSPVGLLTTSSYRLAHRYIRLMAPCMRRCTDGGRCKASAPGDIAPADCRMPGLHQRPSRTV